VQTRDANLETLRQLVHLDAHLGSASGLPFDVDAGTYVVHQRQGFVASIHDAPFVAADTDERSTAVGAQALARGALGAHQVPGLLVAASDERFTFDDSTNPHGAEPARTRLRGTVAAEDEILLAGARVSIVPGVRWEVFRDDFPGDPGVPGAAPGGVAVHDFVSPHLGLRVDAGYGLTLLGNLGRYAREPNLQELFGNRGVVVGNPALRPEVAFNRDVGFRWTPAPRGPLADAALEYAFFDNTVDDLIALEQNTASISKAVNIDSAHVQGHEVDARARLWRRLGLAANYTHQTAIDEGQVPSTHGKRIPGRPGDEAYARVELAWSRATPLPLGRVGARLWPGRLFYELNVVGDDFLDKVNTARRHVASRTYHGVGIELALPLPDLRFTFEVKNAGDDLTRDAFAFPLPGRTLFATVSYGFGARADEKVP
jgi:iron complex outermembrane receptor protein